MFFKWIAQQNFLINSLCLKHCDLQVTVGILFSLREKFRQFLRHQGIIIRGNSCKLKRAVSNFETALFKFIEYRDLVEFNPVVNHVKRFLKCTVGLILIDTLFESRLHSIDHLIKAGRSSGFGQTI